MAPQASCPSCGGATPEGARFCPHCGTRLGDDAGGTAVIEPPPDETGPVPVRTQAVEPHLFGVTPPVALLALAAAAAAVGVLLLVVDSVLAGAILLAVAAVLAVAFVGVARRKPDSELARRSASAFDRTRARLGVAAGSVAVRSRARRRVAALRAEAARLESRREDLLRALGRAVYAHDEAATERIRAELEEVDRSAAEKEEEVRAIVAETEEHLRGARLEVGRTEAVEVPAEPSPPDPGRPATDPPEPARIPEPYPPPGEADPPQPARIPEPYPPPDEGDPPEPARIPEPGGDR